MRQRWSLRSAADQICESRYEGIRRFELREMLKLLQRNLWDEVQSSIFKTPKIQLSKSHNSQNF